MIKVICINGAKQGELTRFGKPLKKNQEIYEGEVYTVINENSRSYSLQERSDELWYKKTRFIPLSNIDETELIKEREVLTEKF